MCHILEWIDINEQLPGFKQECLVQLQSGEVRGGWLYNGQSQSGIHIFVDSHTEQRICMNVNLWMPLPPARNDYKVLLQNPG